MKDESYDIANERIIVANHGHSVTPKMLADIQLSQSSSNRWVKHNG